MLLVEVAEGCEEVDAETFLVLEVALFEMLMYEEWDVLVDDLAVLGEVFLVLVKGLVELDARLLVLVKIFLVLV